MKRSVLFTLFSIIFGFLFSCKEKELRHDETVYVASMDTTIEVKISYPDKWSKNDKIIIWSDPPLSHKFTSDFDSIVSKRDISLYPLLRQKLLDAGYINMEYFGRNDSVLYVNRKYGASDSNTKAADLESLIHYVKSTKDFKKKKIILIGVSEGGTINIKVASKRQRDIAALVQLSCASFTGLQHTAYQREKIGYIIFFQISYEKFLS